MIRPLFSLRSKHWDARLIPELELLPLNDISRHRWKVMYACARRRATTDPVHRWFGIATAVVWAFSVGSFVLTTVMLGSLPGTWIRVTTGYFLLFVVAGALYGTFMFPRLAAVHARRELREYLRIFGIVRCTACGYEPAVAPAVPCPECGEPLLVDVEQAQREGTTLVRAQRARRPCPSAIDRLVYRDLAMLPNDEDARSWWDCQAASNTPRFIVAAVGISAISTTLVLLLIAARSIDITFLVIIAIVLAIVLGLVLAVGVILLGIWGQRRVLARFVRSRRAPVAPENPGTP